MALSEQQLAQLLVNIIKSKQPKFAIQGTTLTGTDSDGNAFELQMFSNVVISQTTAISR